MDGKYDELSNSRMRVRAGEPITQLADAHMQCRRLARDRLDAGVGNDLLVGADLQVSRQELHEKQLELDCVLRATRVTARHRSSDPPTAPKVTLPLR